MLQRPAWRDLRRRLDAEDAASRCVHVAALRRLWMPWVQHARSGRVVRHGAFLRARCSLQFCRVNFCATWPPVFRGSLVGLNAGYRSSGFRVTGVLLRHPRAHAPLTAKSPWPFPWGRRITNSTLHPADSLSLLRMTWERQSQARCAPDRVPAHMPSGQASAVVRARGAHGLRRRRHKRKRHDEFTSGARARTASLNTSAVEVDNSFHDVQAEPKTSI